MTAVELCDKTLHAQQHPALFSGWQRLAKVARVHAQVAQLHHMQGAVVDELRDAIDFDHLVGPAGPDQQVDRDVHPHLFAHIKLADDVVVVVVRGPIIHCIYISIKGID